MTEQSVATFRTLQKSLGAVFCDDSNTVLHYGDPPCEYRAAHDGAVLLDLPGRTLIELTGNDRASFLHGFCTNDIKKLQPGDSCEAFVTNIKGRVLGHIFIAATENSLWLTTVPNQSEALMSHLDRYIITEDVELHDRSESHHAFYFTGQLSIDSIKQVAPELSEVAVNQNWFSPNGVLINRVDWFGQPGFEFVVPSVDLASFWQSLTTNGVTTAGQTVLDTLRIESGFPNYGADITDENLVQEVGRTEQAVSFNKGCYLGQEPVARIDALGHVNRQLVRLTIQNSQDIDATTVGDATLIDAEKDKEIGRITSATKSCNTDEIIGIGLLRTAFIKPESIIECRSADGTQFSAKVVIPEDE